MVRCRIAFLVLAGGLALCAVAAPYRFVSFNIWGDYFGNPPEERDVQQAEILKSHEPDFIALQEMTANFWASRLVSGLTNDYEAVGRKMGPGGIDAYTPILYRRERFELLEKGAEWFHPDLDRSKGVVWVALKDRASGRRIVAFASHFWWRADGAADDHIRLDNARRLFGAVSAAAERHGAAVVGGGDLNSPVTSSALRELKRLGWKDAQESTFGAIKCKTWRDFPKRDAKGVYRGVLPEKAERSMWLDHVFYTPATVRPVAFVLDRSQKALDVSDHSPVVFRFELDDAPEGGWREPRRLASLDPKPQSADPEGWWMKRFREKRSQSRMGGEVVFLGDSITHGWESRGRTQWERYFAGAPYNALNLGFGADRTEHVLWRIENGGLDGFKAKVVVLMIGTNNTGHHPFAECPPIDTIAGIKAIIDLIREKQPSARIILHPIFPRGERPDDENRVRNETVNREIVKFADGRHVIWCDFNDQLLNADGTLSREVMPDLLHPAALGYEVWANALLPVLKDALAAAPDAPVAGRFASHPRLTPVAHDTPTACRPATRFDAVGSRGEWWWLTRLTERRSQIAASDGEFDLVMFGDSITHFWEYDYFSCGWDVYQKLRKRYKVLNLGYGGDATGHLLWRGENGELDGYKAKCVMLMIGTNNRNSPEDTAEGIRRILDLIARKQPQAKILLSPIFPRGKPDDKRRAVNEKVNAIIKGFADGERVKWLDFNARFLEPDGTFKPNVMVSDLLHPYRDGYEIWLDAMLPHLKDICGR